jgi:uncharacterized metal-binding protein
MGAVLSGDFLQLPPVEHDSLAKEMSDTGFFADGQKGPSEANCPDTDDGPRAKAKAEARQGYALWRDIRDVVSLSINIRAPGVLSRLQEEMRSGAISAEMWQMYLSRVLLDNDQRLWSRLSLRQGSSMWCIGIAYVCGRLMRMRRQQLIVFAVACTSCRQQMKPSRMRRRISRRRYDASCWSAGIREILEVFADSCHSTLACDYCCAAKIVFGSA